MISASVASSLPLHTRTKDGTDSASIAQMINEDLIPLVTYNLTLRLYEIVAEILNTFYGEQQPARAPKVPFADSRNIFNAPAMVQRIDTGDFRDLIKYEGSLDEWEASLPPYLRVNPEGSYVDGTTQFRLGEHDLTPIRARQAVFLHIRYEALPRRHAWEVLRS